MDHEGGAGPSLSFARRGSSSGTGGVTLTHGLRQSTVIPICEIGIVPLAIASPGGRGTAARRCLWFVLREGSEFQMRAILQSRSSRRALIASASVVGLVAATSRAVPALARQATPAASFPV